MMINLRHIFSALFSAAVSVVILTGCASSVQPENLEPIIEMLGASEITRTEAVLSARVQNRGTSALSYMEFYYGEAGSEDRHSPAETSDQVLYTLRLNGLKPGTTYSCYVVGGTSTATLRSEPISFTTQPNELPKLSSPVALSTGPIGIIVEFDIVEDGGEPILEAGCEVFNTVSGESERLYLEHDCLATGSHRLNIGGLTMMTLYRITPFASNSLGESKGGSLDYTTGSSIVLEEAGSLSSLFSGSTSVDMERLTVSGYMNGDDFRFLRSLLGAPGESILKSSVAEVDLSDAHIVEGGGSFDGSRFTVADELSTGLMADCTKLRWISLPSSATILARDAFANCSMLESLTISAEIRSIHHSEGCASLKAIEVSPANQNFVSIDGVLFNLSADEILWFPLGKTGAYTLPETIVAIGENAFYGTSITSLEIPPSVKTIKRGAFAGSSLTEISFPDNITNISEGMFQNCASLATIRLGSGTEFIGNYAFDGTAVRDLYIKADIPPFTTTDAFTDRSSSITDNCTLHVLRGCKAVYRNHAKWGLFNKIEEF